MQIPEIKTTLFLIFPLLYLNSLFSQPAIKFTHIKVEDGLSQSWVKCIHQDWQGFMWFGTNDGLNKYDGNTITTYYADAQNRNRLKSNVIQILYEDKNKNLWIGTNKGISQYDCELYSNVVDCMIK